MPSLSGATGWLNSPQLSTEALRGKVVLVDFWTYTCVNWLRTLPYLRAWHERYAGHGLVLLGVHTPEFSFERDVDNVRRAVHDMRITYPVAIDSEYAVWRAFANRYWPALYFVDAQGRIRHHHFGEGEYTRSETVLRQLLAEAGATDLGGAFVTVDARGAEAAADWDNLRSPETYVGLLRSAHLTSPDEPVLGQPHRYEAPPRLALNEWAPSGVWTVGDEAVLLNEADGGIASCFHARDLNLVMGPATPGEDVRFRVLVDGHPPGDAHGADVDGEGYGTVSEQRMYQLIRQPDQIDDRQFAIEFLDRGVEAFVFTYG
jgi:thiol-disulfide isomerase/thioredoxin